MRNNEGARRCITSDERGRINPGLVAGVSDAFGEFKVSDQTRDAANGNAFSADTLWAICRQWKASRSVPTVLVVHEFESLEQSDLMGLFRSWDRERILEWVDYRAASLVMPMLDLEAMLTDQNTVNYQTTAPGYCKTGMEASCEYCVDSAVREGTHVDVEYDADFWI